MRTLGGRRRIVAKSLWEQPRCGGARMSVQGFQPKVIAAGLSIGDPALPSVTDAIDSQS
ncbi:MAG: hypothetical protein QM770_01085 [Tepidisphaeraceae bacterium]